MNNNIVLEEKIPDKEFNVCGLKINPRKRLLAFVFGSQQPKNGFYKKDVLGWLKYENSLWLNSQIKI